MTIDPSVQNQLFSEDKVNVEPKPAAITRLPIPFEYSEFTQPRSKRFERDSVAQTNDYLLANFTPQERLMFHNDSLERARSLGFPLSGKWSRDTFLDFSESNEGQSYRNKSTGKIRLMIAHFGTFSIFSKLLYLN